ncbi:MAG: chorismate mutase [Promethearchaeota archaeon]
MEKIEKLRKNIDEIDDRLVDLLDKRAKVVLEIGILKKKLNIDVSQPQREKEILERMIKKSNIIKGISVEAIWKEILNACKLVQK